MEEGSGSGAVASGTGRGCGTSACSVFWNRDCVVGGTSIVCGRDCNGTSFTRDEPAGPADRCILVHFMTTKMMEKRTTATTIGTMMAATLAGGPVARNKTMKCVAVVIIIY